jgi:2,4-dienoyl-CoA reductase-like NADH-dependent reductase (Old Yellow Enzyme family)/thioredoxin reductase
VFILAPPAGRRDSTTATYPHLFEPGRIGSVELRNRIVKAPQGEAMANRDGTVSERMVRHYRRIAEGGTGLVIIAAAHVDPTIYKSFHGQLLLTDNEYVPGLAWLAETIQAEGAKAGLQLEHCGRQSFLGMPPIKAPSAVPWPALYDATGAVPQELALDEIAGVVEAFGDAAQRAFLAGFDLVEIHGAHGYLITNFLSPHTNKRNDQYGGSAENRMRFLMQVIENIRAKVPLDFPVTMRVSGTDYEPDGIPIEETVEVCKVAQSLGLDAIHVSGGDHETMVYQVAPQLMPHALHADAALAVKQSVSIPVIASGSLTLPEIAEEVLASGKADFVSLGRPLWADPEWPRKALAGRAENIRPCIRCNDGCLDRSFARYHAVTCSVNPTLGREGELDITPARKRKRVAVVGGGPAGLEAARVLALRGHDVVLYEKRTLGGRLNEASAPSFKSDLRAYLAYLVTQVRRLDVEVREKEAAADELVAGGFDAVLVATGARARPLAVPGAESSSIVHALEAEDAPDERVVIVGGGFTGAETALRLREAGSSEVTIVEAEHELMRGDPMSDRITYGMRLTEKGITVLTSAPAVEIRERTVVTGDRELPADRVVVAVGYDAAPDLAVDLRSRGAPVTAIGDAVRPGKIHDAVHAAYLAASAV